MQWYLMHVLLRHLLLMSCITFNTAAAAAAVLLLVIERLSHPRESVRKKAVMALLHFHKMDPDRSGPLEGDMLFMLCHVIMSC